jgi:hypothetical protein
MHGRLSFAVRAADWLTIVMLVFAAVVAVGGGFRLRFDAFRLSFTEADRLLAVAAALAIVRHWRVRRPHLVARVRNGAREWLQWEPFRAALPIAVATRTAVLLAAILAVHIVGFPHGAHPPRVSDDEILNLFMRWDAGWYINIALRGYRWNPAITGEQNIAFFPALPLLIRALGRVFGGSRVSFLMAGVAISHMAFLMALVYLYRLGAREDVIGDPRRVTTAVLLLATYPFAVFYSAPYTEGLWLLAVVGAFWHATRGEWGRCLWWGLLSGLTRPNGWLLSVPIAILVIQQLRRDFPAGLGSRRTLVAVAAATAPVLGLLVYSFYVYQLTGNPIQWAIVHEAWGRRFGGLGTLADPIVFIGRYGLSAALRDISPIMMNGTAAIVALLAVVPVTRHLGPAYGAFTLLNVMASLVSGGYLSAGRLTATMFPVFLWLGMVVPDRHREAWISAFAVGQGLLAVLYFTWRPPY